MTVLRTWWMSSFLAFVANLVVMLVVMFVVIQRANVAFAFGHSDKAKTLVATSCEQILQATDVPKAMQVVQAARCFVEQGKNARAAQLLQRQLEQMDKDGTEGGKGTVENKLQEAVVKVAVFDVQTDAGAEISVDGQVIGKHPDTNPLFLEPGSHVISARLGKAEAISSVEATAASQAQLELKLVTKTEDREIVPELYPLPDADKPKPSPRWTPLRVSISIAGGVVGLGAFGLGIGSSVSARTLEEERSSIVGSFPFGSRQCSATPDLADCKRVANLVRQRDDASSVAIAGFVIGSVGLAAAITALVWPVKPGAAKKNDVSATVTIMPLPRGGIITAVGTF